MKSENLCLRDHVIINHNVSFIFHSWKAFKQPFFAKRIHNWQSLCSLSVSVRYDMTFTSSKSCILHLSLSYCIDGLMQERCNSSALAMELHLSCINPLAWDISGWIVCNICYKEVNHIQISVLWLFNAMLQITYIWKTCSCVILITDNRYVSINNGYCDCNMYIYNLTFVYTHLSWECYRYYILHVSLSIRVQSFVKRIMFTSNNITICIVCVCFFFSCIKGEQNRIYIYLWDMVHKKSVWYLFHADEYKVIGVLLLNRLDLCINTLNKNEELQYLILSN